MQSQSKAASDNLQTVSYLFAPQFTDFLHIHCFHSSVYGVAKKKFCQLKLNLDMKKPADKAACWISVNIRVVNVVMQITLTTKKLLLKKSFPFQTDIFAAADDYMVNYLYTYQFPRFL